MNTSPRSSELQLLLSLAVILSILSISGCVNPSALSAAPTLPPKYSSDPTATVAPVISPSQIAPSARISLSSTPSIQLPVDTASPTLERFSTDLALEMIGKVNKERVQADLKYLTGEIPVCIQDECHTISNRQTGSKELRWAKDYVTKELSRLGYSLELFDWSRAGYTDQNIIARKIGITDPQEEIFFVAHLDGKKSQWRNQFPAADDNASGTVDLLELARILNNYSFNRTIVLFFSTGEEQGTLGVKSYLDQLTSEKLRMIKYVVNIDMIGYDANSDGAMQLWYGEHEPSLELAKLFSDMIRSNQIKLKPELVVGCG